MIAGVYVSRTASLQSYVIDNEKHMIGTYVIKRILIVIYTCFVCNRVALYYNDSSRESKFACEIRKGRLLFRGDERANERVFIRASSSRLSSESDHRDHVISK